jgi:hypothetical protein
MTWHDLFEVAAKFAPLATATIAFGAGTIALLAIRAQRDIARRRAAIDFFLKTEMDQTMIDLYSRFKEIAPSLARHPSISEFAKTKEHQQVRAFLNICELIAVGINQGAFSERVSLAYWGDVLPSAYRDTLPLIEYVRKASNDGSALTYIDLEIISKRWTDNVQTLGGSRQLQLLGITFAVLSALLGFWDSMLPPLVIGSYWQPTAAALSALMSACFGVAAMRRGCWS